MGDEENFLYDLAVDIVNNVKILKDSRSRIFQLEQVRELILHRDRTLLKVLIQDVFNLMVDKTAVLRKFLIKFGAELIDIDPAVAIPHYISLCHYFIMDSAVDSVIHEINKEITKNYTRIILTLSNMGLTSSTQADANQLWQNFQLIVRKLNDFVTTSRTESMKISSLRLMEEQILFGIPNASTNVDPRLAARKDPRLARVKDNQSSTSNSSSAASAEDRGAKTLEEIPLHHPIINRAELQREAEDLFSKCILWLSKATSSSSSGATFSPSVLCILAQVIATVGTLRGKFSVEAAKAVAFLLANKSAIVAEMTRVEKEALARVGHRLLRATKVYTNDPEKQMQKLKEAIDGLDLTSASVGEDPGSTMAGAKRSLPFELEEEIILDSSSKSEVLAALDSAEREKKERLVRLQQQEEALLLLDHKGVGSEDKATAGQQDEHFSSSSVSNLILLKLPVPSNSEFTELSAELFPVHLQQNIVNQKVSFATTRTISNPQMGSEVKLLPLSADSGGEYSDSSLFMLYKFIGSSQAPDFNIKVHAEILCRLATALTIASCEAYIADVMSQMSRDPAKTSTASSSSSSLQSITYRVPVLQSVSANIVKEHGSRAATDLFQSCREHLHRIPTYVMLPRALWVLVSFCVSSASNELQSHEQTHSAASSSGAEIHIEILTTLLAKFLAIVQACGEHSNHDSSSDDIMDAEVISAKFYYHVYEALALVIFSRLLQNNALRSLSQSMLVTIAQCMDDARQLPASLVHLLFLLNISGTSTKAAGAGKTVRHESLTLLSSIVQHSDLHVSRAAVFRRLLWSALKDDFEYRARIISVVSTELMVKQAQGSEELQREIVDFSLIAIVTALGAHRVLSWSEQRPATTQAASEGELAPTLTLAQVSSSYEIHWRRFSVDDHNPFEQCFNTDSSSDNSVLEANAKKALHLFNQLCTAEARLLPIYLELFSLGHFLQQQGHGALPDTEKDTDKDKEKEKDKDSSGKKKEEWLLTEQVRSDLKNIIPAVHQKHDEVAILKQLLSAEIDVSNKPLLTYIVTLLHPDFLNPPKKAVLDLLAQFVTHDEVHRQHNVSIQTAMEVDAEASSEGAAKEDSKTAAVASPPAVELISDIDNFKLVFTMIAILPRSYIEQALPRLIKAYSSTSSELDYLKNLFTRATKSRPPPLSKSNLLVALHRINFEAHDIKSKVYLDVVALCLNNKSEYTAEVIRETLKALLEDAEPPYAIMRTSILSAQSFGEGMKKFVLSEVVPAMVRKQVWQLAPKVWEGVIYAAKNMAANITDAKVMDNVLKSFLTVPGLQLKAVLKAASNIKAPLAKVLQSMSSEDRDECLNALSKSTSVSGSQGNAVLEYSKDLDKQKIVKELSALTIN